uniref:Transposase n=1 Tax=Helianthus annuus TaxID=4232 RepID=A0A251SUT1_HELAN
MYHRDWSDFPTLTIDSTPLPLKRPHQRVRGDRYQNFSFETSYYANSIILYTQIV